MREKIRGRDIVRKVKNLFRNNVSGRRCQFYDLSKIGPAKRVARNPIVQFYSSVNNIGNYLPVLGIRKILSTETDTWCMHDIGVDFDFINRNYKGVIIGGAGLLHRCFERFWAKMAQECKLPMVTWGVGGCFPDNQEKAVVDPKIAREIFDRCDLIDLRDDLTADFYKLSNAHVGPCPSIAYLQNFESNVCERTKMLFSSHEELIFKDETKAIKSLIRRIDRKYIYTDNIQRIYRGIDDIIKHYYCMSRIVVTTRLHGAVIAYGLSIPYVAIPRDQKLRAFNRLYSNGITVENISDLEAVLSHGDVKVEEPIKIEPVLQFGDRVRNWISSLKL